MRTFFLVLTCFLTISMSGQDIYKTPSGTKYHLESCRMVNNVSQKITLKNAAEKYGLGPCKICSPPSALKYGYQTINTTANNKSQGTDDANQCFGITKAGTRCKHYTSIGNDYCYQHNPQVVKNTMKTKSRSYNSSYLNKKSATTPTCGASTKTGSACKRKVKGGGRCYQH